MNSKTADRLNRLRNDSRPIEFGADNVPRGAVLAAWNGAVCPIANELYRRIQPILDGTEAAVVAAAIRDAAANRTECQTTNPAFAPHWWKESTSCIPWAMTARHWAHCRDQIAAVIAAYNSERLAEYEAYRNACEQGVALPPAEPAGE